MTVTPETPVTTGLPPVLPNDSWAGLEAASPSLEPAEVRPDKKPDTPGICPECGEAIVREPGTRGRLPKYHPACKPTGSTNTRTPSTRRTSNAKAEQEADLCIAQFKSWTVKGCIMIAAVDRYDAFALMVGLAEITSNLRGVLIRYEKFRKEWLAAQGGGSLVGLTMSVVLTALPIAAHHGMLGTGPLANQMINTPNVLFKIQQQLKNGEENLTNIMHEQFEAMQKQARKPNPPTPASNGYQATR